MSSPIAKTRKSPLDKLLVGLHQAKAHGNRIYKLSGCLAEAILRLNPSGNGLIRCLDVGCGDMAIAEKISLINPMIVWNCVDIHPVPKELEASGRWEKYRIFDGVNLPFNPKSFDVVMFSDVLHHSGTNMLPLLSEAARVGHSVLVKDHFEYGWYSRQILKAMDFVGNYGYGVTIPKQYFTRSSFRESCHECGLAETFMECGLDLYSYSIILKTFLRPDWQFIAGLRSQRGL